MPAFQFLATLIILFQVPNGSGAQIEGRHNHGLIGYGISIYDPVCASACTSVFPQTIDCKGNDDTVHEKSPSSQSLATCVPYLESIAWCIYMHCGDGVEEAKLESWWRSNIPGQGPSQTVPKLTYKEALLLVKEKPTETIRNGATLTQAVSVPESSYANEYEQEWVYEKVETNHSRYGYELNHKI